MFCIKKYIFLFIFLINALLSATTDNNITFLKSSYPLKINLSVTKNNELIDFIGMINNQNSINTIVQLLEGSSFSIKKTEEPFLYRYPYDINYSDTTSSADTIVPRVTVGLAGLTDLQWFPDGNMIAAVGVPNASGIVGKIYTFSETGSALYNSGVYTMTWGGVNQVYTVTGITIHPTQPYLVICGVPTPEGVDHRLIYIDTSLSTTHIIQDLSHGVTVRGADWSPDGKYLAIAGSTNNNINFRIYKFEYGKLTELPRCQFYWNTGGFINKAKWHPSGKYLALCGDASNTGHYLKVLSFDHESVSELIGCRNINTADTTSISECTWNPDGTLLSTAHISSIAEDAQTFFFDGLRLTSFGTATGTIATTGWIGLDYSPDGAYLAYAVAKHLNIFTTYRSAGAFTNLTTYDVTFSSQISKIQFNPDGSNVAVSEKGGTLWIYKLNENPIVLAKRIKKELLALYQPALQMYNTTQNIIQPLTKANSNALKTYLNQYPLSYTKTFTTALSSQLAYDVDWSLQNNFIVASAFSNPQLSLYQKQNDILLNKPFATISTGASINAVALSPNEQYIAAGSIAGATTKIYSFNQNSLKEILSTATGSNNLTWFADSATLLLNGGVYAFTGTALVTVDATFRANANLDSTRQYIAYTTAPNTLTIAKYNASGITTVTSQPISGLATIGTLAWNNPTTIFVAQTVSGNNIAALYFDGTSLTLIGTGVATGTINTIAIDSQGHYGAVGINTAASTNVYEYSLTPSTSPIIQFTSMTHGSGSLVPYTIKYSTDDTCLLIGNSGDAESLSLYTRNLSPAPLMSLASTYTIIKGTSDLLSRTSAEGSNTLNIQTSYAILNQMQLSIDNSNVLVTIDPLIKNNSNTIAGLLIATSQVISNFVIPNSSAIINIQTLVIQNSYAINAKDTLIKMTSNGIVTYQSLIINNSNAISGLLVATSNAVAGLLVVTSNATAGLLVATSNALTAENTKLNRLNTIDTGPAHLHFNASTITMSYNVLLSTDHQLFVHASGVINGNGHSITFARGGNTFFTIDPAITTTFQNVIFKDYNDASVSIGAGASLIFGQSCRIELGEPQTLSRTWSFAGQSLLDARNNAITLGTGANYLSSLISSSLTLANVPLLNVRDNNIRTAHNNAALIFNNAQLNLSSDFTYSIGSMIINNDVILRGTSIFNYSTIMGLTVASQSKLTIDQGISFNYAPAGNFRNLLSLTDSSAKLFFNNATLVATATGPRLTKGTLLVDGILRLQSAASSQAQAIIFGDGTPANDLIIKVMPSSAINLLSGYLNYANAQ